MVPFGQLDELLITQIGREEIKRLKLSLKDHGIKLTVTKKAVENIVESGYDPPFGARHPHRNFESTLPDEIAGIGLKGYSVSCNVREGDLATTVKD